jgi:predicted NBD/HSP70 family sugar kinase
MNKPSFFCGINIKTAISNMRRLGPNERLLLQEIRLRGSVAKADLARLTDLSTQTASVIINRLLDEKLVRKLDVLRGKVGQPSQPIALDPDGAYAIGLQIGRRELEVALIDFTGTPCFRAEIGYDSPDVETVFAAIAQQLDAVVASLGMEAAARICGVGVAAPLNFGAWEGLLRMPLENAQAWSGVDIRQRVQALTALPVTFAKDTAAACVAELVAGRGRSLDSYLYIFIDTLTGGSLVVNGQPHAGMHGNAGAIGSMPLRAGARGHGAPAQLLSVASLVTLESSEAWLAGAADAIAYAVCSAACLIDLDGVIIDGKIDRALLALLLAEVEAALQRYNWEGAACPAVHAGEVGADAKVIGAAYLSLHAGFAPEGGRS